MHLPLNVRAYAQNTQVIKKLQLPVSNAGKGRAEMKSITSIPIVFLEDAGDRSLFSARIFQDLAPRLRLRAIFVALLALVSACAMDKTVKREEEVPLSKCRASIAKRLIPAAASAQTDSVPAKTNTSGADNASGDNQPCSGSTIVIHHGVNNARLDYVSNALIIEMKDTDDCLVMTGFNPNDAFRSFSDVFEFNGEAVCARDLIGKGFDLEGTKESEIILGTDAPDRITGHGGNDTLNGGDGNDVYYYNPGDGLDCISDSSGDDVIALGPGLSLGNISIAVAVEDKQVVAQLRQLDKKGKTSQNNGINILLNPDGTSPIELLRFDDSAVRAFSELIRSAPKHSALDRKMSSGTVCFFDPKSAQQAGLANKRAYAIAVRLPPKPLIGTSGGAGHVLVRPQAPQ